MIVAIDGPAGVGKSTVAHKVGDEENLVFLNSGSFYRAITLGLLDAGIDISDARIRYIGRVKKNRKFADIYFAEKEFCLSDCVLSEELRKSRTGVEVPEKLFPEIPEYSGCVQDLLHQNSFSGRSGNGDVLQPLH